MEKCLFCHADLSPAGSEEHVFLSTIGGRLITHKATCSICNNDFATAATGKLDDTFAESFIQVRNALKMWSGRDEPPPTITRAGRLSDGTEFDFAPGLVPVAREAKIPDISVSSPGTSHRVVARDIKDAKRVLDIFSKRGYNVQVSGARRVREKAPGTKLAFRFVGPKAFRAAAKAAVLSVCVLYGNERAREKVDPALWSAIKKGQPDICLYAGWDYINVWPVIKEVAPHQRTPNARLSGFEHLVVVTDVGDSWIAYIEFFGGFTFSVRLGACSGLATRGLAVNPRSSTPARFVVSAEPDIKYQSRNPESYKAEFNLISNGIKNAFERVLEKWRHESQESYFHDLSQELLNQIIAVGDSEEARTAIIRAWAEKIATIEMGDSWAEDLDTTFNEDEDIDV